MYRLTTVMSQLCCAEPPVSVPRAGAEVADSRPSSRDEQRDGLPMRKMERRASQNPLAIVAPRLEGVALLPHQQACQKGDAPARAELLQ